MTIVGDATPEQTTKLPDHTQKNGKDKNFF